MTYLYEALERPTRLYIKQCPHCGLKYFGKSVSERVDNYRGSGVVWRKHLKKHRVNPVHLWNSDWFTSAKIKRFALLFSRLNDIVESKSWANIKDEDGLMGGDAGPLGNNKRRNTMISREWKDTVGAASNIKRISTLTTIANDPLWKSTKGAEKSNKLSSLQNDPLWKSTKGVEKRNKASKSISKIKTSSTWKTANYKRCDHCHLDWIDPANYSRWHGDKCKMKGL